MKEEGFDLERLLSTAFRGLLVRVTNRTPCHWNATIVGVAVEFRYSDGSKNIASQYPISLGCNESTILQSEDKCVKSHFVGIRVEVDGETRLLEREYPGEAGKCQTRNDIIVAPKEQRVDERDIEGGISPVKEIDLR